MIKNTLILATLLIWGCTSAPSNKQENTQAATPLVAEGPVDQSDTITVIASGADMSEMTFDIKAIRVPANKTLTIALKNESTDATMPHNLVIVQEGKANDVGQAGVRYKENSYVKPNDPNVIAHSPLAQINQTVYFTFTTPTAGDYAFICSYPGHWGMMKGKFLTR